MWLQIEDSSLTVPCLWQRQTVEGTDTTLEVKPQHVSFTLIERAYIWDFKA